MAKKRLINCEFLNASSFIDNLSNKSKLLYVFMLTNADDKGFVSNAKSIIESLEKNDIEFRQEVNLTLLDNDYHSAMNELIDKGLLFEFIDRHNNSVYVVRHWFMHNCWKKGLMTNYVSYYKKLTLEDGEYHKKPLKENNINQDNINNDKEDIEDGITQKEWEKLCGGSDKQETTDADDDLPF